MAVDTQNERPSPVDRQPESMANTLIRPIVVVLVAAAVLAMLFFVLWPDDQVDPLSLPPLPATTTTPSTLVVTGPESTAPGSTVPVPVEPDMWDYYGNPWSATYLANLPLDDQRVSYRFTAKTSGQMAGFQNYFTANVGGDGYASGTGGIIHIQLVPDDGNGLPDLTQVLADTTWTPGLNNGLSSPPDASTTEGHPIHFAEKFWNSPPTLTAGLRYHIVFDNIDANPDNWISLNNSYAVRDPDRGPLAPSIDDWGITIDLADGNGFGETTKREKLDGSGNRYETNLLIIMDDGSTYGNAYMEAKQDFLISGSDRIRQIFRPRADFVVDQLSIFGGGNGTMRIDLLGDDAPVGSWTIEMAGEEWTHHVIELGSLTLETGVLYSLEFSADSGSMEMGLFRDGSIGTGKVYGLGGSWSDGYAQVSTGGDWEDAFFAYADLTGVAFSIVT